MHPSNLEYKLKWFDQELGDAKVASLETFTGFRVVGIYNEGTVKFWWDVYLEEDMYSELKSWWVNNEVRDVIYPYIPRKDYDQQQLLKFVDRIFWQSVGFALTFAFLSLVILPFVFPDFVGSGLVILLISILVGYATFAMSLYLSRL